MEEIIKRIKAFEGFSLKPYQCPAKKWTIGYGYNYQDRGFNTETMTEILTNGFSAELADRLVRADAAKCAADAEKNFGFFGRLDEVRRAVIVDMAYQLGIGDLKKFKKMLVCLAKGDYAGAAAEMQNSAWYRQSGRRSEANTAQMRTGKWQEVK